MCLCTYIYGNGTSEELKQRTNVSNFTRQYKNINVWKIYGGKGAVIMIETEENVLFVIHLT